MRPRCMSSAGNIGRYPVIVVVIIVVVIIVAPVSMMALNKSPVTFIPKFSLRLSSQPIPKHP